MAYWQQDWGASGGLAAQLCFLAKVRPDERFNFSLVFIPIPVNLSAWQSCFAHLVVDVFVGKAGARNVLGYFCAWAVGWFLADAWMLHLD